MDKRMQQHEAYQALPRKVSQQVLIQLHKAWTSFFEAREEYAENPSKFTGRPRLPNYKHKSEGRNLLVYTIQAISGKELKQGLIHPSMLPISVKTKHKDIDQVRIVPRNGYYVVEVIYSRKTVQAEVDPSFCVAIDLGVTNLAAITSNREGWVPRLVNGRPIKSVNQWYNKRMKELKLCLPKDDRERVTKQMEQITNNRNRQINRAPLHAVFYPQQNWEEFEGYSWVNQSTWSGNAKGKVAYWQSRSHAKMIRVESGKTRVSWQKLDCLKSNLDLVYPAAHRKTADTDANPYAGMWLRPAYLQGKGELPTRQSQEMNGLPKRC